MAHSRNRSARSRPARRQILDDTRTQLTSWWTSPPNIDYETPPILRQPLPLYGAVGALCHNCLEYIQGREVYAGCFCSVTCAMEFYDTNKED